MEIGINFLVSFDVLPVFGRVIGIHPREVERVIRGGCGAVLDKSVEGSPVSCRLVVVVVGDREFFFCIGGPDGYAGKTKEIELGSSAVRSEEESRLFELRRTDEGSGVQLMALALSVVIVPDVGEEELVNRGVEPVVVWDDTKLFGVG